ncbi:MAG: lyase family protein [Dissulfuribacterales bacterium]
MNFRKSAQCKPRLLVLELAGATGTLATIDQKKAFTLQELLAKELSLTLPNLPWHVSRDHLVELTSILAYICGTCSKIANEIITLQRTEIAELEQEQEGRIGSSTMPHKRNPMQFEHIVVLNRFVRNNANAMLENLMGEHERDWRTWGSEMKLIEESFIHSSALLEIMLVEIKNLVVNENKMKENLDILKGLMMSERVMMKLAEKLGRQTAHNILHDTAKDAFEQNLQFNEVLKKNSHVSKVLSAKEIDSLMDPMTYVGLAPKYIERLFGNFEDIEK